MQRVSQVAPIQYDFNFNFIYVFKNLQQCLSVKSKRVEHVLLGVESVIDLFPCLALSGLSSSSGSGHLVARVWRTVSLGRRKAGVVQKHASEKEHTDKKRTSTWRFVVDFECTRGALRVTRAAHNTDLWRSIDDKTCALRVTLGIYSKCLMWNMARGMRGAHLHALLVISIVAFFGDSDGQVNDLTGFSLNPPYFNLAEGSSISATATCGHDEAGRPRYDLYCKLVGGPTIGVPTQNIQVRKCCSVTEAVWSVRKNTGAEVEKYTAVIYILCTATCVQRYNWQDTYLGVLFMNVVSYVGFVFIKTPISLPASIKLHNGGKEMHHCN